MHNYFVTAVGFSHLMEILLDETTCIIKDNIYLLPDFRRVITEGNVYASLLRLLPIEKKHYEKLNDLDLILILRNRKNIFP